ncbi:hypothetical protein AC579_10262 [Pseudocercospora musae]|uniref:Uncharacterized protein n=1 Tax=Pseudocercospora musae TaxID=113226 RepID=A0A139HZH9_9PEZI|nr:hypothetical protein AC579_10262 [Pseudocercospora musae]
MMIAALMSSDYNRDDLLFKSEPTYSLIFCNSRIAFDMPDDYLTSVYFERNWSEREDSLQANHIAFRLFNLYRTLPSRNFQSGHGSALTTTCISARG